MKQRLADYVADFLVKNGIKDCFTVVGGGAMHLNDALGHKEGLKCIYNHHEQACAMAAESYARLSGNIAAVCVTTGPGGTNAITGVLGGWLDSIPMLIISGQVRFDTTARYMEQFTEGLPLRAVGDQEFDITKAVGSMCKYAVMLEDPMKICYVLEKALYEAKNGRPGPAWIDIPVNYQGMMIETEDLCGYDPAKAEELAEGNKYRLNKTEIENKIDTVIQYIKESKRPVIYAGNGIRIAGAYEVFLKVVQALRIPVVTCWDSIDLIETENSSYVGRGGIMGDRAGNFAIQNADFILAIGNRLSIRQVGYNWKSWAPKAKVLLVDIDPAELKKTTIHVDDPICADAREFLEILYGWILGEKEIINSMNFAEWSKQCLKWKENYPVTLQKHWNEDGKYANVYAFIHYLSDSLLSGAVTVVSNGSACVVGSHNYVIQKESRFLINSGVASMGYGLPAAIGACVASGRKRVICIEGDGSIMMNLQELQTMVTNQLPIKIFLINNEGYHSIRQTQNNLFKEHSKVGIGEESKDLSFPKFQRIAEAFGIRYMSASSNEEMKKMVDIALMDDEMLFCEVFVSPEQIFEPKSATKRLEDGTLVSPPLEDMAPFLPKEELEQNMIG